jgi:hypothetical protein
MNLLDARPSESVERHVHYQPALVERLGDAVAELVFASVKHFCWRGFGCTSRSRQV